MDAAHDVAGRSAIRVNGPDPAEANSTSQPLGGNTVAGIFQASPMMSGSRPGVPSPLEMRATTSHEPIGNP